MPEIMHFESGELDGTTAYVERTLDGSGVN
jgi:hypothetical protein